MPSLIDPPVGPFSEIRAIEEWIEELRRMPPSDDVLDAIAQAELWLKLKSA